MAKRAAAAPDLIAAAPPPRAAGRMLWGGYYYEARVTRLPVIANTAFARSGGASRGLARTAALATGLKWPIMAFARSTIP